MSASESGGGPKQVDDPAYHSEHQTAVQPCKWAINALCTDEFDAGSRPASWRAAVAWT